MRDPYYRSSTWYRKCARVKARCGGRCEYCGVRRVANVHHRTYERFGRELMRDLMGVCRPCHRVIHRLQNRVVVSEDSLAARGDSGLGDGVVWQAYLAGRKQKAA